AVLYKFDISSLLARTNVVVGKANLHVYVQSRVNRNSLDVSAFGIKRPWSASTVNWNFADTGSPWQSSGCNGPDDRTQQGSPVTKFDVEGQWESIDVTSLVSNWQTGDLPNEGIILKGVSSTTAGYTLISQDHSSISLHPYLEVVLAALPTGTPTSSPTPTSTPLPAVLVQKVGPPGPLYVEGFEVVSYTITLTNNGVFDLTNIVVTDTLPLGTEFIDASDDGVFEGDEAESGAVIWQIPSLSIRESRTLSLRLGIPTWVKRRGNVVNLVRTNCLECMTVQEDYWEIFVNVPTPTYTPTATDTPTPTATVTPSATPTATPPLRKMYFVLAFNNWRSPASEPLLPMYFALLHNESSLP
ncbi:MAG: DNRLRE domain-containing protein, partial [Synergistales bacterium]|nr:DNRLRE domain-containing protein [Synergistales bacterium]